MSKPIGLRLREWFANWLLHGVRLREGLKFGDATVTITTKIAMTTVAPTTAGDIGMDATSGRPQAYIGGAARDLFHTADTVANSQVATEDGDGLAPAFYIRKAFTAGGGGSPDDVIIYNANAPFGFRIVDSLVYISTSVALSTVQLRDATGGGGAALSDAFPSSATGIALLSTQTTTTTVAASGTMVLRRSDNGVAGEVIILLQKT